METRLRAFPILAILVYYVSRWGSFQDTDESAHYEFACKSAGVPVHYCAETTAAPSTLPSSNPGYAVPGVIHLSFIRPTAQPQIEIDSHLALWRVFALVVFLPGFAARSLAITREASILSWAVKTLPSPLIHHTEVKWTLNGKTHAKTDARRHWNE